MKAVLLIFIFNAASADIRTVEFNSMEACAKASDFIEHLYHNAKTNMNAVAVCLEKGKE